MQCQACGQGHAPEARFCSHCGAALDPTRAPVIAESARPDVMTSLRGEERLVTVVFADLTESVRRTSGLSPEEATGLVNPLLETMVDLMVRHGGRIDRFLGDGVLAVFGVPAAHEDDPLRGVRAAIELRERADDLDLEVTAGVNTGRVYFGPVGSTLHEELTVMGPTVNLAARLQSAAGHGEVLIGEATARHVSSAFELSELTLAIKGIDAPVTAYRAERLLDNPGKVRGISGLRSDLIGRGDEMGLLDRALRDKGRTVALIGPAGVGKSRLAAEFNRQATGRGFTWLEGRCVEVTRNLAWSPLIDLLRRYLGGSTATEVLVDSLDSLVEEGRLERDRADDIAPFLAHLLGGQLGDGRDLRVTESDPRMRREFTIDALVGYIAALARRHEAVIFLDDLHWSDESSLSVLARLHERLDEDSSMLLLALRPDGSGGLDLFTKPIERLSLGELSDEESRRLVMTLLDIEGVPDRLTERIVANAAGNPFYVEEIIRTFIQRGVVRPSEKGWEVVGDIDQVPVPESVEGLLMSRFDRLPLELRRVARMASILDGPFLPDLVEAMVGAAAAAQLPALVEVGLLSIERSGGRPEYGFVHALTRDAIRSNLLPSHRAELHRRAGEVLESRSPDDFDRLAYHFGQTDDDLKAVRYLFLAGDRAMQAYANDQAMDYFEQGLDRCLRLAPDDQGRWRGLYRARIGELLGWRADHGDSLDALHAALETLEDPFEVARAWRLVGRALRLEGQMEEAHQAFDRAEEALDQLADRDSTRPHRAWIDIQRERGFALYFGGRGRELAEHNQKMARVVNAHGTIAQRVDLIRGQLLDGFVAARFRVPGRSVALARQALDLALSGADPGRIAETYFVLGFALLWADEVEEAVEALDKAIEGVVRVGDVTHENRARAYYAIALRRCGRVEEAEKAASSSLDLATRLQDSYYQGHALSVLCWGQWRRGDRTCRETGETACQRWGSLEHDGYRGLNVEFGWMAVLPLAAEAADRGAYEEAARQLLLIRSPWERPLGEQLTQAVDRAIQEPGPGTMARSMDLARASRLL